MSRLAHSYDTLIEAPIVEEIAFRFVLYRGMESLINPTSRRRRNPENLCLCFGITPWGLATSSLFGLLHVGNFAWRLKRIHLTGVDHKQINDGRYKISRTRNSLPPPAASRQKAADLVISAICQSLLAFYVSLTLLTPVYEQHGIGASIAAHSFVNFCQLLTKIVSELVMGGSQSEDPQSFGHNT